MGESILCVCRERRDKEPFAITSHESKAIECLKRMGNLKIEVDSEIFCEPGLDTRRDFACRQRRLCLVDEVVCEHSFLALLVLGSGDQVIENAGVIVDVAEVDIFSELHVVLQGFMLMFLPLPYGEAAE